MFHEYDHETMWAASREEVDELERLTHYHKKIMITAFFNGTGQYFLNILPRAGLWRQATLLERLLADWKMSAILAK
jgi:hypothetical protein